MRFPETAFITANWIEWCPLIGLHLYIYIVFKALNLNGTDIMGLTFKLLNPEDVIRVLERERRKRVRGREMERGGRQREGTMVRKQKKETSERVSVTVCSERQ